MFQRLPLILGLALAGVTATLCISAYRAYITTTPTSAIVIKVETKKSVVPLPITESEMLNPASARDSYAHSIYVRIPEISPPHGDVILTSIDSEAPPPGSSLRVRYRTMGQTIEVFPEDAISLFAPALLPAIATIFLFSISLLLSPTMARRPRKLDD